ncbi:YhcH/YjgK/YiaL family protein [Paenibacillus sp. J5C_2022]|uniref:YhcH/YjgK/YiaL family protein n=1 Tax=Paenibacillus sp. J5C2022 TaxID=2977129 RepID=UPI0021CE20D3|nr:YhcH/YjgK/YiaL family protein [Paenibacillus sp. J5C2022]MCU6709718.1 YhcH/YjgK/YiaL family protein [Paenibacillus sp. J5C2022]
MIFGDLKDFEREQHLYPPVIRKALAFIQSTDWSAMPNGRVELDGELFYVNIGEVQTTDASERKAERHFRYTDIHYIIEGEEIIGFTRNAKELVITQDLSDQDALLYNELNNETHLKLRAGEFIVTLPHDVHRPGCANEQPGYARKAIFKIDTNYMLNRS